MMLPMCVHTCTVVYTRAVCKFTALGKCMCVFLCETLIAPAGVLLGSSIGWIIKGPGGQPIGSAVITVPRWNGAMG